MRHLFSILLVLTLSGCASNTTTSDMNIVIIKTSMGEIIVELDVKAAPKTVENFLTHVENEYYDELGFHRVIPDFMIQGGDPEGNGSGGESIWGEKFEDEINAESYDLHKKTLDEVTDELLSEKMMKMTIKEYYEKQGYQYDDSLESLPMKYGHIAMANAGPNTNGSQFFIIQRKEGAEWLNGKHTVFGKVTEGMDIVDAIANVPRGGNDMPLEPVTYTIEITE